MSSLSIGSLRLSTAKSDNTKELKLPELQAEIETGDWKAKAASVTPKIVKTIDKVKAKANPKLIQG